NDPDSVRRVSYAAPGKGFTRGHHAKLDVTRTPRALRPLAFTSLAPNASRREAMIRERALKVILVLVGLFFTAGSYPVTIDLWHRYASDPGETMMMSLYITLGIFLLISVRNPSAHRSLIAFAAWSCFAHAVVMSILAFGPTYVNDRKGFLGGSAALVAIGVALLALSPAKASRESVSATAA